jgi:hypothetical protein
MFTPVRYFLFIALFGIAFSVKATHNRAGEITYKWISGYTYSITLTTYTDDGPSIADRCQMTLYFGDGDSCQAIRENGFAAPSNAQCPTSFLGVIIATSPTIKKNIYSCIHTYAGPGLYKIYMFDRNRNSGVINIPNSVNEPFYLESMLSISAFTGSNNSSVLTVPPIDMACLGKCFYHNAGAYDSDGDSLSYEIVMCKGEDSFGNMGVTIPGYSFPSPGASGVFKIDSLTGTVIWCNPQQPGEYNIAFIIREWRKMCGGGTPTLVGYVIRDMQIIVNNSPNNPPQFGAVTSTCVAAGSVLSSVINTSDPDNQSLTISASGSPFILSTATFPAVSSVNASGTFSWATSCSDIRREPYSAFFKVTDNYSFPLSNFLVYDISVNAPAPQNLMVVPGLNTMQLSWNKPACHPTSGNKIAGYSIYRINSASSWTHSACETGVPVSSGFGFVGSTFTENDTTTVDYSVSSLPNNSTVTYVIYAYYKDCSESYASAPVSNQLMIGIDEQTKNNYSATLFPNPGSGLYNLELSTETSGNFTIELMDVNGRVIKTMLPTFVKDKAKLQLDFNSFGNGYYILKIENEEKNCTFKPLVKI